MFRVFGSIEVARWVTLKLNHCLYPFSIKQKEQPVGYVVSKRNGAAERERERELVMVFTTSVDVLVISSIAALRSSVTCKCLFLAINLIEYQFLKAVEGL